MNCENNTSHCTEMALEEVTALGTPQIPALRLKLCHTDAAIWCAVLEKRGRDYDRTSLLTGKSMKFRKDGFIRTARVGRGVAKK